MNDFTKEELQVILKLISTYDRILNMNNEKLFEDEKYISNKILSMIDNYCGHESDGKIYELQPEYKCKKCGEFYR